MSKIANFVYQKLFRNASSFVVVIGLTAVFADRFVDFSADSLFAKINEGRLFKDVKKQLNLEAPK